MIGNFAEAIAGIFGGLLAAYSLRYPFYAQALIAFSGIPAAFALQELNIKSKVQSPVQEIVRIIRYSLVTNKRLCYNIMFSGIIGAATLTMAWFVQPYLMYMNTPTSWFGVIWISTKPDRRDPPLFIRTVWTAISVPKRWAF